jgi:hypothetical protein
LLELGPHNTHNTNSQHSNKNVTLSIKTLNI